MDTLNFGIIGFGIMGKLYGDTLHALDGTAVAAVAEIAEPRRRQAADRYGCPVFESYEDMLAKTSLDAAVIALPDFAHRGPVVAAAQAGCPLLIEKPFATSLEDLDAMAGAIRNAGVTCSFEFSNRWGTLFVDARERIQGGQLGEILSLTTDLNDTLLVPTEMLSWAGQSTPAWFLMSHTADLTEWITGRRPVRVFATGTKKLLAAQGIDTYDVIEALVDYDNGATGRLTSGWVLPKGFPIVYEFKMRLIGADAAIDIDMSDQGMHLFTQERYEHPSLAVREVLGHRVGAIYNMIDDFVRALRTGQAPMVTLEDGIKNTRFLLAVHESLETGNAVDL